MRIFAPKQFYLVEVIIMKNDYKILGSTTEIYCTHKGEKVTVLISTEDFNRVASMTNTWWVDADSRGRKYATAQLNNQGKRTKIKMHRWITECPMGMEVDHINHDPLDNRRDNLRIVDHSTNLRNVKPRSSTGILGVHDNGCGRYAAKVGVNNKSCYLGTVDTIEEAADRVRLFKLLWGLN